MSDEVPRVARTLPIKACIKFAYRIGEKCVVTTQGDGWICAHGTDGTGKPGKNDPRPEIGPMGSIGVDPTQARIYYHPGGDTDEAKTLIVSPNNTPFLRSSSGRVKGRSKSFHDDGSPVSGVLFYYALETGRYDDRMRALNTLSLSTWPSVSEKLKNCAKLRELTFGDIFAEIERAATDPVAFKEVLRLKFAEVMTDEDGTSKLELWKKAAKKAAMETGERIAKATGEAPADFDARFLQAVRETTLEHGGLPAQCHVRERWIALANPGYDTSRMIPRDPGEWKDNRKKLGFDWLPPLIDWKRYWLPLRRNSEK